MDDFNTFVSSEAYTKMIAIMDVLSQGRVNTTSTRVGLFETPDTELYCSDCDSESSDTELDVDTAAAIASIINIDNLSSPETEVCIDHKRVTFSKELRQILESGHRALRGIDIGRSEACSLSRCANQIRESKSDNKLCINEDSLTAWVNRATELFCLRASDIRAMKKGEQLEVVLFDRNLGDYMHGTAVNSTYDPIKGCQPAVYTHRSGLSGSLLFPDIKYTNEDFEWEVNGHAVGSRWFWRPLNQYDHSYEDINLKEPDIADAVPVGWRGPCIRKSDALKYLPQSVTHYGTWYDDYVPFRYDNYLTME